MKQEKFISLKELKELRIRTGKWISKHSYTKNRIAFQYTIKESKQGKHKKDVSRYHLFNIYTLKHLESYDTTRIYNSGSVGGFGCWSEDTSKTTQKEVKTFNIIDNAIFDLVNKHK